MQGLVNEMAGNWTDWLKNSRYLHEEKLKEDEKANRRRTREEQAEFNRTVEEAAKEYRHKQLYGEPKREKDPNAEYHHGRKQKTLKTREEVYGKTNNSDSDPRNARTRKKNYVGEGKDFEATPSSTQKNIKRVLRNEFRTNDKKKVTYIK